MRILVTLPSFTKEAEEILSRIGAVRTVEASRGEVEKYIGECEVVVVGLGVVFDGELLKRASKLKVLATATTGLDHIDLAAAETLGITVLSLRGEDVFLDTIAGTAELAMGLMLSLARSIPRAQKHVVEEGLWVREDFREGVSLYGKTLGIVGLGRLGKILARMAEGFRMRVVYTDPHISPIEFPEYEKVDFDTLLASSDFISINVHLKEDTQHMFNADVFKKMKSSAYLINTSRGGVVDEEALLLALQSRTIAGYGTDVLDGELSFENGVSRTHPLVQYASKNHHLIMTPHIGGMTADSRRATDLFIAEKVVYFISGI